MKLDQYRVVLDTPEGPVEHTVPIYNVDRLLCEKEGPRYGIRVIDEDNNPVVLPQHLQTFWCYAALKRLGHYSGTYASFATKDCIHIDGDVEDLELSPTTAATPAASPSSSPSTGRRTSSGSTRSTGPTTD